jgi:MFS family permease
MRQETLVTPRTNLYGKLILLGSLYLGQTIPFTFFLTALPALLRERGVPLEQLGLIYLLVLGYIFKFLWAPYVDRYSPAPQLGHYRAWLLVLLVLLIVSTAALALIDPISNLPLLLGGVFVLAFVAATLDTASAGLAVKVLGSQERGLGNSMLIGGKLLGVFVGSGGILYLYSQFGWATAILIMAALGILPLLTVLFYRESEAAVEAETGEAASFKSIGRFFKRPGSWRWILTLTYFWLPIALIYGLTKPFLVDIGLSLEAISFIIGIGGATGGVLGAVVAGYFVKRWSRAVAFRVCLVFQLLTVCTYLLTVIGVKELIFLYLISTFCQTSYAITGTILGTLMMDRCETKTAATDYNVQWCGMGVGVLIFASLSTVLAAVFSYAGVFILAGIITVLTFVILPRLINLRDTPASSQTAEAGQVVLS